MAVEHVITNIEDYILKIVNWKTGGGGMGRQLCSIFIIGFFILISLSPARAADGGPQLDNETYYLFAYFKDKEIPGGGAGLHLAWSEDGLRWTAPRNGDFFFKPKQNPMFRDPNITQGPDGAFHLVWTTGWNSQSIGYASSTDLIHWSEDRIIPVMAAEPRARNVWAPETFYDAENQRFLIIWSSTIPGRFPKTDAQGDDGYNHRIYYTTTTDFSAFAPAKLFYDPGFNCIDATIVKDDAGYTMFLKNETRMPPAKYLVHARSRAAAGPYGRPSRILTHDWSEGPTAARIGGKWFLYFDRYSKGKFGLMVSDDLKNWTDMSDALRLPEGVRHGTVFAVSRDEMRRLLENISE
jgi:hypothetical protein